MRMKRRRYAVRCSSKVSVSTRSGSPISRAAASNASPGHGSVVSATRVYSGPSSSKTLRPQDSMTGARWWPARASKVCFPCALHAAPLGPHTMDDPS